MGDDGWEFSDYPGAVPDTVNGARHLREIYLRADPHYTGRVTTPVPWDTERGTIVNNQPLMAPAEHAVGQAGWSSS